MATKKSLFCRLGLFCAACYALLIRSRPFLAKFFKGSRTEFRGELLHEKFGRPHGAGSGGNHLIACSTYCAAFANGRARRMEVTFKYQSYSSKPRMMVFELTVRKESTYQS